MSLGTQQIEREGERDESIKGRWGERARARARESARQMVLGTMQTTPTLVGILFPAAKLQPTQTEEPAENRLKEKGNEKATVLREMQINPKLGWRIIVPQS